MRNEGGGNDPGAHPQVLYVVHSTLGSELFSQLGAGRVGSCLTATQILQGTPVSYVVAQQLPLELQP